MIEVQLAFQKSTKNTHVYVDDQENAPVASLYVNKSSLPKQPPEKLKLTIAIDE